MARSSISNGPNYIHPEKAGAIGSRNSTHRDDRSEYVEASIIIDEQIDKILNHISSKVPPEVLERIHIGGTVKEILHNYFNQGFQNMINRYLVTTEDEMAKKFHRLIDQQESRSLNRYTPREIPALLDSMGGLSRFNSSGIENSIVSIFGQLQKHIQKGIFDIEHATNKLLRKKAGVGAFVSDRNSYSIVKCYLGNNSIKPETVADINLVVNVVESELLKPIYHYRTASEVIIKDIISKHILELIDKEVDDINSQLIEEDQNQLSESDVLIEKLKKLEHHIEFNADGESTDSAHYEFVARKFIDAIKGVDSEVDRINYDLLSVKDSVSRIVEEDNTRNKGFNAAVNTLTGILDRSHLGYQHIQNFKNARKLVIREYADTDPRLLPDERYAVTLTYFDSRQLQELKTSYCQQLDEFVSETDKIWQVYDRIFLKQKQLGKIVNFDDIAQQILSENRSSITGKGIQRQEARKEKPTTKKWDEVSSTMLENGDREKINAIFKEKRLYVTRKLAQIRKHLKELYEWDNPSERVILDQRLDFLENSFGDFERKYNPFHLQAGLVVEIALCTIKRKEITMNGMALVLNDFLSRVALGFTDKPVIHCPKQNTDESKTNSERAFAASS